MKTPPLAAGVLAGITRAFTIEVGAAVGICCQETPLTDEDLFGVDEAFFTSTTKEIVPIVQVADRKIGDRRVGSITKELLAEDRGQAEALSMAGAGDRRA